MAKELPVTRSYTIAIDEPQRMIITAALREFLKAHGDHQDEYEMPTIETLVTMFNDLETLPDDQVGVGNVHGFCL